ncbi:replication protein A 70 kDa DNA-binding subunit-like [Condylostylus longicornis]|uniref:replication protein A 70 kDa DNA-binding subunit-like n=1 Tax=Condylostylus longicornis TaxID=2530218 RepID=UPI00244DF068|nr:replication protein A 70 kDa DNA-binding subunit-like [Condylostylus longicornis]XP_055389396.1 replication protein A 70 kDa DNA-binding subunit-like [Condylostylus longicornis]
MELSSGCLESILSGADYDKPKLQILGTKRISGNQGTERYRLLVSDGKHLNSFAMLASQLNNLSSSGQLSDFTIIQVDKYISSVLSKDNGDKRVLIILDLTIMKPGEEVGRRIGNPQPFTLDHNAETSKQTENSNKVSESVNTPPRRNIRQEEPNSSLNQSFQTDLISPISSLSPYKSKWVIKVRILSKSPIRSWSNAGGEGKLFSMDLIDESGEIRATAFRNECEKFFDMIEVDKVYKISKCQLKQANKKFCTLNNDYEMTFTPQTIVQLCTDNEDDIPQANYNWVPISQVSNMEPKAKVDVIGICREIGELQTFTAKTNNRELKKRELTLVDTSNAAVQLTLWGDEAVKFDGYVQPVIAIRNGIISEFGGGKSITMVSSSVMKINPDFAEGHKLRGWFDNGGAENISSNISNRIAGAGSGFTSELTTFFEAKVNNLGISDKPDYFQIKGVVHLIKNTNLVYKACPQTECNKKVIDEGNGNYRCEKCNALFTNFKYRLLLNLNIGDWTSTRWVSCFNEVAEIIVGKSAQDVGEYLEQNSENVENIFEDVHFKQFTFKLRSVLESYGDTQRTKITVLNVSPICYKEYNKYLIKNLQTLLAVGKN